MRVRSSLLYRKTPIRIAGLAAMAATLLVACATTSRGRPCVQETMAPPPSGAVAADDPTVTDPDKYQAVFENDRSRVLRYHDEPGARTHQHRHPATILYALSAFRRKLTFPDGTINEREFKPGDVMWVPAQTHIGENTGGSPTEVLLVEIRSR